MLLASQSIKILMGGGRQPTGQVIAVAIQEVLVTILTEFQWPNLETRRDQPQLLFHNNHCWIMSTNARQHYSFTDKR